MHAAPPVRVNLGRSAGWIAVVALCVGIAAANVAAWALLQWEFAVGMALVIGVTAAALTAWRLHRARGPADLVWTGAEWQWQGVTGIAVAALDLDGWMLLRFDPAHGQRCWIAASRRSAVGPWPALRAALYARRPDDALVP